MMPFAAVADLLCSVLNQNVTAWRSSRSAVTIEKEVVSWIAKRWLQTLYGSRTFESIQGNLLNPRLFETAFVGLTNRTGWLCGCKHKVPVLPPFF
jgi:hypothetical protein